MATTISWYFIHFNVMLKLLLCIGQGEYVLMKEFSSAGIPSDEVLLLPTISLEDIVKSVKEGIKVNVNQERK